MLFFTSLLIIAFFCRTEGVTVTSVQTDPYPPRNGTPVSLRFCDYSLSSGESINSISWSFSPSNGSSWMSMATYDSFLGFSAESNYVGRLSRPDPNLGYLLLNDPTTNDSGNYSCTVVTNGGRNSSFSIVIVVVPPNKANLTLTQVNEYLYCQGLTNAGTPPVSLQIVMVATSTAIATQESLTVTTRWNAFGNHICRAILINFPNFTVPGVVDGSHTVRDYPKVMNRSLSILTVENGDNITLEALITGDPAPQPAWSRGGTNSTNTINSTHILATLQFTASIREGETQLINCTASDDVGYGFVTFQIASQDCSCRCPCKCTIVIPLVIVLAIVTTVLFGWTLSHCFKPGGICESELVVIIITVILMIITAAFVIAVGAYSLNCYGQCTCAGCSTSSCCVDADCLDAYRASIAFVVLGSAVVIFAIVVLVRPVCSSPRKTHLSTTTEVSMNDKSSNARPGGNNGPQADNRSSGNKRHQGATPPPNPQGNGNQEPQNETLITPRRQLPPLRREENTDNDSSEKKKKKKKAKKDQPESEEPRPLPTPSQPPPETERRPSMDVHVNMSASNNSPLPIKSTFNPGGENAMPPVGSSSLKRN